MTPPRRPVPFRIVAFWLAVALVTVTCSSSYITPASLTATAAAPLTPQTPLPTAFLVAPTLAASNTPEPSATPQPQDASPTPEQTATETPLPSPTPDVVGGDTPPLLYTAQSGDSLDALAARFGVSPFEIVSDKEIPRTGFINPGQLLVIPVRLADTGPNNRILPDSDLVYSPSAVGFDAVTFGNTLGGHLAGYREYLGSTGWLSGPQVVQKVADENSINPRVLLSLLEYNGHWVLGEPQTLSETDYPMGHIELRQRGLHGQLVWAVNQLSIGYYGWRAGTLTTLTFTDGSTLRLAPDLNAGTVAIQYLYAQVMDRARWDQAVAAQGGIADTHNTLFGDAWGRAAAVEPLFPSNLEQAPLILPFLLGQKWAFTGGPHGAWEGDGSQAAIDFAPGSTEHGCAKSDLWAVAASAGVIVRSGNGVVVLDLDGDGYEQTGWVLLYLHVTTEVAPVGKWLDRSDLIGHPSCEGGFATGTHIHFARKYNGEWVAAAGPLPFTLSGWSVQAGAQPYQGFMVRGDDIIEACTCGSFDTIIARSPDDP
ncbi:MAG: LysM peptidoglycan-binding domain-containing protein [Anaerolineae bacterium]|nr:MAG: LysM peptidoglycan-binding domain-containing protein [Anaerolineae bacterium]